MQIISVDELVDYKILPFNLFNEGGENIMTAGEVLTPGKLLQLRYLSVIYRDGSSEEVEIEDKDEIVLSPSPKVARDFSNEIPIDKFSLTLTPEVEDKGQDDLVNAKSHIASKSQIALKQTFNQAFESIKDKADETSVKLFNEARDKVLADVLPVLDKVSHKSELRMIGDYDMYHGLNVAILSTMLAKKMGYNENQIADITLAALLHDIGKARLPEDVLDPNTTNKKNLKLLQLHPQIGYKILKNEMNLPESICKVALEHHEKNDGSGYPYNISGDLISQASQIVSVCSVFDNLISNKGHIEVKNPKEAVKEILDKGTAWFSPEVLYTFVHMTNYNDTTPIEELNVQVGSN